MEILVNHLTRMQLGVMCVAGINLRTGRHVRPVVKSFLRTELLARHGGAFDIGNVVDLGRTLAVGHPPEIEDHRFDPRAAHVSRVTTPEEFWSWHVRLAKPDLCALFGPDLKMRGQRTCGTDFGRGVASLGCLVPRSRPALFLACQSGRPPQVRMGLCDGIGELDVRVTDIRLYGDDHVTPNAKVIADVAGRLAAGVDVILSVGLTRPFTPSPRLPPVHWLQVNNIHLRDKPLWALA